jgi:hypothetical protein
MTLNVGINRIASVALAHAIYKGTCKDLKIKYNDIWRLNRAYSQFKHCSVLAPLYRNQRRYFLNRFKGIDSSSLCSPADQSWNF